MMASTSTSGRINIVQGEYHVSADPGEVITTLLGSCVAACLHDEHAGIGGMNHFLLPGDLEGSMQCESYGLHLMELLVNAMLKQGARRNHLKAKLFGGAKTVRRMRDIGSSNATFAREFLVREDIEIVATSLGGSVGRRLQYWPVTGRARQMLMNASEAVPEPVRLSNPIHAMAGELELF